MNNVYAPKHPCGKDCHNRGAFCLKCEAWKKYELERNNYYEKIHREKSVERAASEKSDNLYHKNLKFKRGLIK